MKTDDVTPCLVFFDTMKKHGGISYKEMATRILSGCPLPDGNSPLSRVSDTSWVSRYVIHAPAGTVPEAYFSDFPMSALRIVSRLKKGMAHKLESRQIIDIITGSAQDK